MTLETVMFKKGDTVKCIAARDICELTVGKEYLVLEDEDGEEAKDIYPGIPYVTVEGNYGPVYCHAARFEKVNHANL